MFEPSLQEVARSDLINSCRTLVESQEKEKLSQQDIECIFENDQFIGHFHQLFALEDQHLSTWLESLRENLG